MSTSDLRDLTRMYDDLKNGNDAERLARALQAAKGYTATTIHEFVMQYIGACAVEALATVDCLKQITTFEEYQAAMMRL